MSALSDAQIAAQATIRAFAAQAVTTVWRSLPGHDRENIDEWLSRVLPIIAAVQRQSVAVTRAYIARSLEQQPVPVDVSALMGAGVRNGTAPADVYQRPFVTVWTALKNGTIPADAVNAGLSRAISAAAMDVQLASTHTIAAVGRADPSVGGWERVTDGHACALCRIAATQRYRRGDLLPIHNNCACTARPLLSESAGARVLHPDRLAQLKADGEVARVTAQRQAAAARKESGITVAVRDHGELGPLLTNAADNFTTESSLS